LFTGANKIILANFVSMTDIGLFSLASRLASFPLLLVGCFNMAYNPHFIQSAEKDEKKAVELNSEVIGYWYVAVLAMILGFVLFSDSILKIMSTQAYYMAAGIASILVFSSLFRGMYMFAVSPLFFKKKTYLIPIITLVAGCVSIGLNLWAIPKWGIMGAAWVTVVAYFLTFIISEQLSKKALRIIYPWKKIIIISCVGATVLAVTKWISFVFPTALIFSWIISAIGLIAYAIIGILVTNHIVIKRVFGKALRLPFRRFRLFIEEEQMTEDMENKTS